MAGIWSEENRYQKWLDVELAACEAWAKMGKIPKKSLATIKEKACFTVERIEEIEAVTRHDVIAFVSCVAEYVGEDARFIHMGLTSSDVLDTAYSMLLMESSMVIIQDIKALMESLKKRAYEFKDTPAMGRSHGIHAEPITFGLKFALWYSEMERNLTRMLSALEVISYGKISGAVGTFANVPPEVEAYVCKKLGLKPAPISTQVLQRDRHAEFFATLAIIGATAEKIATEIRHLQRTEVLEAMEPFGKGQKGSSAMPHKKNPIGSENITGLARLLRGTAYRPWRTWRSGMSATSATQAWRGLSGRMRPRCWTSCLSGSRASSKGSWSFPKTSSGTWSSPRAYGIPRTSCWHWWTRAWPGMTPMRWSSATRFQSGRAMRISRRSSRRTRQSGRCWGKRRSMTSSTSPTT